MEIAWSDVVDFVTDYSGKIMFLAGALLMTFGVLNFNMFGTMASAISLFLGILFLVFGLFVLLGVFSVKFRSADGLGLILICASVVSFAFSFAILQFLSAEIAEIDPYYSRWRLYGFLVYFHSERPYLWASSLFALLGLALVITGVVLKIYHNLRS
jgi:uncharacterized membrane protein HdeD (DUF308 family)